jgi:CheY-like chemotaxis protein
MELPPDPDRILEAARLETLGLLSLDLAHDFNNLLSVSLGWAEPGAADSAAAAESFREIRKSAERGVGLTRRLLALGRGGPARPRVVDVASTLRSLEPLLRTLAGDRVGLRIDVGPGPLRIRIDAGRLDLAILGLALRARQRIGERGTIAVSAGASEGSIRIAVEGPGSGEPPAGLAYGAADLVARGAGGRIEISPEGVALFVPAQAGEPAPAAPTILLAAGDADARSAARRSLEAEGWPVLEARSGREALAKLEDEPGAVDILVAHAYVPPPSGSLLALRAKSLRPALRVFRWGEGAGTDGIEGVLDADPAALGRALRTALG